MNLVVEGISVGIVVVIIGYFVSIIVGKIMTVDMPRLCREWNKNHIMEICLFITGFLTHVIFELLGLNKWYCLHGRACQN